MTSPRLITRYALYSGLIAGVGLVVVYAGLFRLGLSSSGLIEGATNGAQVLSAYVHFSYGAAGDIFLGVLMTLACTVTAIGLTSACGSGLAITPASAIAPASGFCHRLNADLQHRAYPTD